MSSKLLFIINNEKISKEGNNFYCDNIDIKSIPEYLNKNFDVSILARSSREKRTREIGLKKIIIAPNILLFLYNIFKTFKENNKTYLVISITPYTFLSIVFLLFFRKKFFLYLRSNGYEEYKSIFGFMGHFIYSIMFKISTYRANVITCQERLFAKEKSKIVYPSELTSLWMENIKKVSLDKVKLLYIGRIRIEKGIFSLLKILDTIQDDTEISIIGNINDISQKTKLFKNKKIKLLGHGFDASKLINIYDEHNIFILPSFTEAHPKVVDESLARLRPVIIFEEIKHIIQDRKGIFVCKRNKEDLIKTINFIMKNYTSIQESISKNKLPTKKEFFEKMDSILRSN